MRIVHADDLYHCGWEYSRLLSMICCRKVARSLRVTKQRTLFHCVNCS